MTLLGFEIYFINLNTFITFNSFIKLSKFIFLFINQSEKHMISQSEIKKLQQTINRQLQGSPLGKKMMTTNFLKQISQTPGKVSALMQTSQEAPQIFKLKKNTLKQDKKVNSSQQKKEKLVTPVKSSQDKKQQQRQFLISQNKSLKQQTLILVQQLQLLLNDPKQKKYGTNFNGEEESKQIKLKKTIIAKKLAKITQLQSTIAYEKRQLKYVYDDEDVIAQEAQTKILESQLQKLQREKKAIGNVLKEQNKGISLIQMTPEFREKFNKTKDQLQKIKEECKLLQLKTLENQRLLKKRHQKAVGHQTKVKKIQKILKEKEDKKKRGILNDKYVTLQMIAEVQQQIAELEFDKVQSEKQWGAKIMSIETQIQTRKLEEERKILILNQKEKQVRLNDLRIKELKKLVFSQTGQKRKLSVSQNESKKQQVNQSPMQQGRKRNIIIMDSKDRQTQNVQNS